MTEKTQLLAAATAVSDARVEFTHIDGHLAALREKFRELSELRARVNAACNRRVQLLESAMLEGRKADTAAIAAVDKEIDTAIKAVEKRKDEFTAIEGALATLQAQQEAAQFALAETERAYREARTAWLRTMEWGASVALQLLEAISNARADLAALPAPLRDGLLNAKLDLQSEQLPTADSLREAVTSYASADLVAADKLAALPPPPPIVEYGYLWSDGTLHPEPEPQPERGRRIVAGGRENAVVGLVAIE